LANFPVSPAIIFGEAVLNRGNAVRFLDVHRCDLKSTRRYSSDRRSSDSLFFVSNDAPLIDFGPIVVEDVSQLFSSRILDGIAKVLLERQGRCTRRLCGQRASRVRAGQEQAGTGG
jgi:hypothetical protein